MDGLGKLILELIQAYLMKASQSCSQRHNRAAEGAAELRPTQTKICENANELIATCQLLRFAAWIRKTDYKLYMIPEVIWEMSNGYGPI